MTKKEILTNIPTGFLSELELERLRTDKHTPKALKYARKLYGAQVKLINKTMLKAIADKKLYFIRFDVNPNANHMGWASHKTKQDKIENISSGKIHVWDNKDFPKEIGTIKLEYRGHVGLQFLNGYLYYVDRNYKKHTYPLFVFDP